MTSWSEIEAELRKDFRNIHRHIKNLAPQDSMYKSFYKGQVFDYIIVNNNPVYSNTNNLYNSVEYRENGNMNKTMTATVLVSGNAVPYYERAVLRPELRTVVTFGQRDYGDRADFIPHASEEEWLENRNYLYYMKAQHFVKETIGSWNGRKYYIKDRMEDFK